MRGIVVRHKPTGNLYAITESNLDKDTEEKVRDLKVGESVRSFKPYNDKKSAPAANTVATNPSSQNKKENK